MLDVGSIIGNALGGQAAQAQNKLADDFDTFLTLLTAQLQSQDPLDPLDSKDFTQQLIQFTSVEQAIRQNENLENLTALAAFNSTTNAVGYLGNMITAQTELSPLVDGEATWLYRIPAESFDTKLTITDENGEVVATLEGETDGGQHSLVWDGKTEQGDQLPDGVYRLAVSAKDAQDNEIPVETFLRGKVRSIETVGGESLLDVGGVLVPLTSVAGVIDPSTLETTPTMEPEQETEPAP